MAASTNKPHGSSGEPAPVAVPAPARKAKSSGIVTMFTVVLLLFCVLSFSITIFFHGEGMARDAHPHQNSPLFESMKDFTKHKPKTKKNDESSSQSLNMEANKDIDTNVGKLSTLQCDAHGGPSPEVAQEMVYWRDVPSDSTYTSPFHSKSGQHKRYMTFEPDGGGWNNIRMSMETVFGMAHAMGRILVLPPAQRLYLLGKGNRNEKKHFSFADFFPVNELAAEHVGLEIISMEEFLKAEAMTGNMKDKYSGKVSFPPGNRTNWDGENNPRILKEWLRNVTHTPLWRPNNCMASFPASGQHKDVVALQNIAQVLKTKKAEGKYDKGTPVPVNGELEDRMRENLQGRSELCVYDEQMQQEMVVHFMCYHKMKVRLLVHFYNFLFFENWIQDLWNKRFIRDHVRYIDEIQCAAARVVEKVRERARKRNPLSNSKGEFDSFHIRRGDFQYKKTRIEADEIVRNSQQELTLNSTVYIATDERNKSFFQTLSENYDVVFLDDFQDVLKDVNMNYYGMLDQLIASRGRVFFGCWFSTFTGYITRIRGYHSVKDKADGYESGSLPTTFYYTPTTNKNQMVTYKMGHTFAREFPISWRDIDKGIGELS